MTNNITYIKNKTGETRLEFFDEVFSPNRKCIEVSKKIGIFYIYGNIKFKPESNNIMEGWNFTICAGLMKCYFSEKNIKDGNILDKIADMDMDKTFALLKKLAKKDEKAKEVYDYANIVNYDFVLGKMKSKGILGLFSRQND